MKTTHLHIIKKYLDGGIVEYKVCDSGDIYYRLHGKGSFKRDKNRLDKPNTLTRWGLEVGLGVNATVDDYKNAMIESGFSEVTKEEK